MSDTCHCHDNYVKDVLIPQVGVITDIREETPDVKTFRVNAPEGGKLSVRTSPAYNAAEYCAQLGGGGHAAAAGATVPGGIAEAKEAILRVLRTSGVAV